MPVMGSHIGVCVMTFSAYASDLVVALDSSVSFLSERSECVPRPWGVVISLLSIAKTQKY